ncbi:MAG: hypothetical protein QXK06_04730 [Candidatus Diapherotrites archaeon]
MAYFCPQCYGKNFITVPLKETSNGVYVCTRDPNHKFVIDRNGFPKSKKD